ncbi:mitochondrial biogenesis AIM24-domain-containing protein [Durotheca rogersii]|uniref:mitochondrial biogenesis AIM24-domain-containing protein n=1 Tax=Durotheca rogersii TaxID=419775 RepID=UPI00221FD01A|nr:mitochondrial biogenesis AIM24-domain-containing protein [Durotheca rogersii]KAI5859787.1 mitochondrial biogenesis AIM24-domain-containing protein [Durotheca rogersii]
MRGLSLSVGRGRPGQLARRTGYICRQCRAIQISSSPTTESPHVRDAFGTSPGAFKDVSDARFEVLGAPYSLLSVSLSASQRLYTRRGTLVAVSGKAQNASSTLSLLSPFIRAVTGVPFLYQRITSTTPLTALISTKSPTTTFYVLHLDGTTDWMIAQRSALLAWTGHSLTVTARLQHQLPLARWGSSEVTGRGLAALSAPGHIYQLTLAEGEEFVAHPANVVAYTITKHPPLPFRFKSTGIRFQVPSITAWLGDAKFLQTMRGTEAYKFAARALFGLRTTARRTIWGDRLFLQFRGPTTLLLSSRGTRISDVLSSAEVNELADASPGVAPAAVELKTNPNPASREAEPPMSNAATAVKISVASIGEDGKAHFEDAKSLKEFEK